jgi:putative CocE/NonD family hydrolase
MNDWQRARFAPPPEQDLVPCKPSLIDFATMRDGVRLYTEIFLPAAATDPGPVVLIRSPYPYGKPSRHDNFSIPRYLAAGYAVVYQLTRGQGASEGEFRFFLNEQDDGYDCLEWMLGQAWCNGSVGMHGVSYLAGTQLLAARAKHPALKCIMPSAFVGSPFRSFPFSNGVPNKGPFMQWCQLVDAERRDSTDVAYGDMNLLQHPKWAPAFRHRPLLDAADNILSGDKLKTFRQTIADPVDGVAVRSLEFSDQDLLDLDIPVFITDGWHDMTVGPINYFSRLDALHGEQGPDRYLLVGPWSHSQTFAPHQAGEKQVGRTLPTNAALDLVAQRLAFFDRYLKEEPDILVQRSRVRVYITGAETSRANTWLDLPTFPAPNTFFKHFYLHSQGDANNFPGDGVLSADLPEDEPADHYRYDPALPTGFVTVSANDRRPIEIRADVLSYTSAPLKFPMTILGDIVLELHAATDGPDTDWFAILTEVFPDGQSKSFHYAPAGLRARYREGGGGESLLSANQPTTYRIPMGPAGHQIAAGHRLRLSIFSAAFPEYEPNSNTGSPPATDCELRVAQQTVFHNKNRPSHLLLPLIAI